MKEVTLLAYLQAIIRIIRVGCTCRIRISLVATFPLRPGVKRAFEKDRVIFRPPFA